MEQLGIFPKEKEKICAFSGHRALGEDFSFLELDKVIKKTLKKGVRVFLNGMAVGFDLMAAEVLLTYLDKYPDIRLIACLPCENQDAYYSKEDKIRYRNILILAETVLVNEKYHRGCMLMRDDYMAKQADMLITYCKKKTGGTAYTVKQFLKYHPEGKVIYL